MARHMVTQCGLSDAIGPIYVTDEKLLSEDLKRRIDAEVHSMLVDARAAAKALLNDKIQVGWVVVHYVEAGVLGSSAAEGRRASAAGGLRSGSPDVSNRKVTSSAVACQSGVSERAHSTDSRGSSWGCRHHYTVQIGILLLHLCLAAAPPLSFRCFHFQQHTWTTPDTRMRRSRSLQDLHALAGALMEHETLTLSDIQAVLAGDFQRPPPSAPGRQQPKGGQEEDEEGQKAGGHEPAGADLDSLEAQKVL